MLLWLLCTLWEKRDAFLCLIFTVASQLLHVLGAFDDRFGSGPRLRSELAPLVFLAMCIWIVNLYCIRHQLSCHNQLTCPLQLPLDVIFPAEQLIHSDSSFQALFFFFAHRNEMFFCHSNHLSQGLYSKN